MLILEQNNTDHSKSRTETIEKAHASKTAVCFVNKINLSLFSLLQSSRKIEQNTLLHATKINICLYNKEQKRSTKI